MKRKHILIPIILALMLTLTACPDSTQKFVNTDNYGETISNDYGEAKNSADGDTLFAKSQGEQKLIYSGSVSIGTDSIKKTSDKVAENMKKYDAFFESVNASSTYKTMIIRIPKKNYMAFYDSLSEVGGEITSSNIDITDSTKTYTDNAKRIEILQTEYDELKELMQKAETVEEVLSIRERMSTVTYEIESLKGSNETIDYDADYGKLSLTLNLNGSHDEASFGHRLKEAFSGGFHILKSIIIGLAYFWWAFLLAAYMIFATQKNIWPFRKRAIATAPKPSAVKLTEKKTKKPQETKTNEKKTT